MELSEIETLIQTMAAQGLERLCVERAGWRLELVAGRVAEPVAPVAAAAAVAVEAEVRAPLAGVLHWRPAPDAAPFVVPGQAVRAGEPLCIIEAMKVFNQVRAERDLVVAEMLVQGGAEVEAGQALVRLA